MPIDPRIALGFKPTYELESPQNILANVMKVKGEQQAQQINALTMQEKQRGMESQNALNRAMSSAYNQKTGQYDQSEVYRQLATGGQGHLIPGQMESEAKRTKAQNESQKAQTDLLGSRMKQFRDFYSTNVRTPDQMRQFNAASAKDPVIGKFLEEQGVTLDQLNQEINDVEAAGPKSVNQYRLQQVLDADKFINANKSTVHFPPGSDKAYVSYPDGRIEEVAGLNTGASQRITPYQQGQQDVANRNLGFREREVALKEQEAARKAAGQDLKPVPVPVQKAITGSAATIAKLDRAIQSITENPNATGLKGLLPDVVLNRAYPEGTVGRANVADIGSLVMHERSGAAVTASESPRLKPFIPLTTDDDKTVLKKLKRMREIQSEEQDALLGTYNPEQGFREFKPATVTKPSAPGASAKPSGGVVDFGSLK